MRPVNREAEGFFIKDGKDWYNGNLCWLHSLFVANTLQFALGNVTDNSIPTGLDLKLYLLSSKECRVCISDFIPLGVLVRSLHQFCLISFSFFFFQKRETTGSFDFPPNQQLE